MRVIKKRTEINRGQSEEDLARLEARIKATQIEHVPIGSLKANSRNAKKHPQRQIALLAANIQRFGITQPLVVDENGLVLCGHGRLEACKQAGLETVAIVRLTHLTSLEKKAIALADNKLAELGSWDDEILAEDLKELTTTIDLGFDFEITGFDSPEVDALLTPERSKKQKEDPADLLPAMDPQIPPITKSGDVWVLGQHLLLCGDATAEESYRKLLLNSERANLIFSDPPYNVPISGNVTKRADVPEFEMASGEMTEAEYTAFLRTNMGHIADHAEPGAVAYVCMDWRHLPELLNAARPIFGKPKNLAVWVKSNAGMGSFYRSQHEHVAIFVAKGAPPINNFGLGGRGRFRTNVWTYPGLNAFGAERKALLAMHPTVKPVSLVADAIRDCSNRNHIVLDPFGGSGTTLIACERTSRKARLMELDPHYCDVIIRRFEQFTGESARHQETGEPFTKARDGQPSINGESK